MVGYGTAFTMFPVFSLVSNFSIFFLYQFFPIKINYNFAGIR